MTANDGRFKKGDPRINRNGRPKTFDALRKLAQSIAQETLIDSAGNPVTITTLSASGVPKEHLLTVAEGILRKWATSKSTTLQQAFIEVAYGTPPKAVDITTKGESLNQGVDEKQRDRAISELTNVLGAIVSQERD